MLTIKSLNAELLKKILKIFGEEDEICLPSIQNR